MRCPNCGKEVELHTCGIPPIYLCKCGARIKGDIHNPKYINPLMDDRLRHRPPGVICEVLDDRTPPVYDRTEDNQPVKDCEPFDCRCIICGDTFMRFLSYEGYKNARKDERGIVCMLICNDCKEKEDKRLEEEKKKYLRIDPEKIYAKPDPNLPIAPDLNPEISVDIKNEYDKVKTIEEEIKEGLKEVLKNYIGQRITMPAIESIKRSSEELVFNLISKKMGKLEDHLKTDVKQSIIDPRDLKVTLKAKDKIGEAMLKLFKEGNLYERIGKDEGV